MNKDLFLKRLKKYFVEIINFRILLIFVFIVGILLILFKTLINSEGFMPVYNNNIVLWRVLIVVGVLNLLITIIMLIIFVFIQMFCYIYFLKWLDFKKIVLILLVTYLILMIVHFTVIFNFVSFSLLKVLYTLSLLFLIILCYNNKHV